MEPLNLMVSLSHFANSKSTLPPKQPRRARKARTLATRRTSSARRAAQWFRTAIAR